MAVSTKKWTPATSQKRADSLLSNKFIHNPPFIASFERKPDKRTDMWALISHEYAKMWNEEHKDYDQVQFPPKSSGAVGDSKGRKKDLYKKIFQKREAPNAKRISFRSPVPPDAL